MVYYFIVYVNTAKNPSFNQQSNSSTLNTSGQPEKDIKYKANNNYYLDYDFDYKETNRLEFSGRSKYF